MTGGLLTGSELVLVAQVPKAGDRWKQVHLNAELVEQFFRVTSGDHHMVFERVDDKRRLQGPVARPLVFSEVNRNFKIEFDFGEVSEYPAEGVPLLAVLELDLEHRRYRYVALFPGDAGYEELHRLNAELPSVGRGLRRVITTLDEIELRWPGSPLRSPKPR